MPEDDGEGGWRFRYFEERVLGLGGEDFGEESENEELREESEEDGHGCSYGCWGVWRWRGAVG